jgi:hypothetical protein
MARNRALKAKFEKARKQRLGIFGQVAPLWSPGLCLGDYRTTEADKACYRQGKSVVPAYDPAMVVRYDDGVAPKVDWLRRKGSVATPRERGRMVMSHKVAAAPQCALLTPDVYAGVGEQRLIPAKLS